MTLVDGLVSFHYFDDEKMEMLDGRPLRLIADSGAFSAWSTGVEINVDKYAQWLRRWGHMFCWSASLDVIGDEYGTLTNWLHLRDRHQLLTVPTVHFGAGPDRIDRYAREGVDLIGLGGMAQSGHIPHAFRWLISMFRHARDHWPDLRFHLWGISGRKFLDVVPAWSSDSSGTISQVSRFANLRLFDPRTGTDTNVRLVGNGAYTAAPLLRRVYGITPADIERSTTENRDVLVGACETAIRLYWSGCSSGTR